MSTKTLLPNTTTTDQLRVLLSLAPPDGTTKYVNQMVEGAPETTEILFFSWKTALTASYDVFHVHWPELLLRGHSRRQRFAKRQAMRLFLLRLRLRRIPLVRTVHNLTPHEQGTRAEQRLLGAIDRQTSLFIRLNPTTPIEPASKAVTILHGHYRERFARAAKASTVAGRLLYFGIIRPYKGVDTLLEVFAEHRPDDLSLRIVGSPSPELRELIEAAAVRDDRISARLAFVPDDELVHEVSSSELVVLPYREMHNSGAILVALSLDRPVLVPRSASNTALSSEVGRGWVLEYDGELTDDVIIDAFHEIRTAARSVSPELSGRDWATLGLEHHAAYQRARSDLHAGGAGR